MIRINIQEIINLIALELYNYTGSLAVPSESIGPKPNYPYLAYKVTTPYIPPNNQGNYSIMEVEGVITETVTLQPTFTISVNAYSDDSIECQELIKKAYDWFRHVGYQSLSDINVVVVNVRAFGDRTLLIVDNYETRIGFDTTLRTVDTISREIEAIEEYSFKEVKDEN